MSDVGNFQKQNWKRNIHFNSKLFWQLFCLKQSTFWKGFFQTNSSVQGGCDLSLLPVVPNPVNSEVARKGPNHYKWEENIALPIFSAQVLSARKPWARVRARNSRLWSRHARTSMRLEAKKAGQLCSKGWTGLAEPHLILSLSNREDQTKHSRITFINKKYCLLIIPSHK